ncbi:MAG: regulator of cell autolysis, partial [Flavobacterium sp.]
MRLVSALFGCLFLMVLFPSEAMAQDSIVKSKKMIQAKMSKAADDLKKSLSENDEAKIAKSYEVFAQEFIDKG